MCICRDNVMRCMGRDSLARRCIGAINRLSLKWHWPPNCHCEEAVGRRGALSAKREEVPLGCNLGKAVTFSPGLSCYPTGYCEIATAPLGPRNDNSGVHTILLLAMTRQEGARCTSALLRLNHPRTRRSGSAAKFYYPAFRTRHSSKSATYQYQPLTSSGSHCVKYAISGIWPSAR